MRPDQPQPRHRQPHPCRGLRPACRGSSRPWRADRRCLRGRGTALLAGMPASGPRRRPRLGPAARPAAPFSRPPHGHRLRLPAPDPRRRTSPQPALAEGEALLVIAPHKALSAAEAVLRQAPGFPPAEFLAARALRRMGKGKQAVAKLDALARGNGLVPAVLWELGQAAAEADDTPRAIAALQALTQLQPGIAGGWFLLARQVRKAGRADEAWRADLSGVHASSRDTGLLKAALAVQDGDLESAD